MDAADVEGGTDAGAGDVDQWFDRPMVLALGILVSVVVFCATGRSGPLGPAGVREAGLALLVFVAFPSLWFWRTPPFRVFAAFWLMIVLLFMMVTGLFGAPPFWWPLVMIWFVAVAFFLPSPRRLVRGFLMVGGALVAGVLAVSVAASTTPPARMQVLIDDPAMHIVPAGAQLESSDDEMTCHDHFDDVQPSLSRSYTLSTQAIDARRDVKAQLVALGWHGDPMDRVFTKEAGDTTLRVKVETSRDGRALTIFGEITSFDFCADR